MKARGLLYGVAFSLVLWVLIIGGLSQCLATNTITDFPSNIKAAIQQHDRQVLSASVSPQSTVKTSRSRIIYANKACSPDHGINPWIYLPDQNPVVGGKLYCSILASYVSPRKNYTFLVAIADHLLSDPLDLAPYGANGCVMMVPLQTSYLFVKGDELVGFSYYRDGIVEVAIDIPVSMAGKKMYLQAAIFTPENKAGFLVTQTVEWWIPVL